MRLKAITNTTPIGLALSGRALCAVQLTEWRPDAPVAFAVRLPRIDPTVAVDAQELARAAEALHRQGFRGRSLVITMPPPHLMTEVVDVKGPGALEDHVRAELARAHRIDADSFEMGHWPLPPRTGRKSDSVMAVACRHDDATAHVKLYEAAGFEVVGLDVEAWALARACRNAVGANTDGAFVLDVGWDGATLAVLLRDSVLYTRTLTDSALSTVHRELGNALELDRNMTDYLLDEIGLSTDCSASQVEPGVLHEVHGHLVTYVDKLAIELRRSINYVRDEFMDASIDRLLVVGEGAAVPGLTERLTDALGMTADTVTLENLATCRGGALSQSRSAGLAAALGLARYPKR